MYKHPAQEENSKIFWQEASREDLFTLELARSVVGSKEHLLLLIFDSRRPLLCNPSLSTDERCHGLSRGEKVLIKVILDLWDGSGGTTFNEVFERLDNSSLINSLMAMSGVKGRHIFVK